MLGRAAGLVLFLFAAPSALAGEDPLEEARAAHELGSKLLEVGGQQEDGGKIADGIAALERAQRLLDEALASGTLTDAERDRAKALRLDAESRISWWREFFRPDESEREGDEGEDDEPDETHTVDPERGASLLAWCRDAVRQYEATEDSAGRAAVAREMASKAGIIALDPLLDLLDSEEDARAREGIREGLVSIGGSRVASAAGGFAADGKEKRRSDALEVIYASLEKPEREEKERPFCRAIRRFHERKDRKLTLGIIRRLDAMGTPGVAALGEVLYVEDFGYHDHTIRLLAKKKDRRAVPPLVYKMNRFKFEFRVQWPAHQALLDLGWYAVPELIDRLDDKAAGIWISWTLRKITGETMGTTKWKWHDWWKHESVRHPELFEDEEERPEPATTPR